MVQINSEITGLRELAKNSDKLRKSFSSSTLRTALRGGAAVVRKLARERAPVDEGDLKKGIKTQARKVRNGQAAVDIGFDRETAWHGGSWS